MTQDAKGGGDGGREDEEKERVDIMMGLILNSL